MGTVFSTFDTTPANVVADIKAKILLSSDWSNPAGDRVVCTTTRGAAMVVDLANAAATATQMSLAVYRTSALLDKVTRYMAWRSSGGTTSDPIHVRVSAGKEHIYFDIEGPRTGEPNPEIASLGSSRQSFFLGDVLPYFVSDTVPTVVLAANTLSSTTYGDQVVYVSRNQGNSASWVPAHIASMQTPTASRASAPLYAAGGVQRLAKADGKTYMFPYVIFELEDGLRGSIAKVFFTGFNFRPLSSTVDILPSVMSRLTYSSDTYILLTPDRYSNTTVESPFGRHDSNGSANDSAVIAIPYS